MLDHIDLPMQSEGQSWSSGYNYLNNEYQFVFGTGDSTIRVVEVTDAKDRPAFKDVTEYDLAEYVSDSLVYAGPRRQGDRGRWYQGDFYHELQKLVAEIIRYPGGYLRFSAFEWYNALVKSLA